MQIRLFVNAKSFSEIMRGIILPESDSQFQNVEHPLCNLPLEAPERPQFGFAFRELLLVIHFSSWIPLACDLGKSDHMEGFIESPIAERIGMELYFLAARSFCRSDTCIHGKLVF